MSDLELSSTKTSSSKPQIKRVYKNPAPWILLAIVVALGLTADLSTKAWMFREITLDKEKILNDDAHDPLGGKRYLRSTIIPGGILDARLVINHGAVFGIGQKKRAFFIAFTIGAVIVGLFVFARWPVEQKFAHLSIGLILAGGLGNLFDRWAYAVVRDFLHLLPGSHLPFGMNWPGGSTEFFPWVFNIADVLLLTGMIFLIFQINIVEQKKRNTEQALEDTHS